MALGGSRPRPRRSRDGTRLALGPSTRRHLATDRRSARGRSEHQAQQGQHRPGRPGSKWSTASARSCPGRRAAATMAVEPTHGPGDLTSFAWLEAGERAPQQGQHVVEDVIADHASHPSITARSTGSCTRSRPLPDEPLDPTGTPRGSSPGDNAAASRRATAPASSPASNSTRRPSDGQPGKSGRCAEGGEGGEPLRCSHWSSEGERHSTDVTSLVIAPRHPRPGWHRQAQAGAPPSRGRPGPRLRHRFAARCRNAAPGPGRTASSNSATSVLMAARASNAAITAGSAAGRSATGNAQ